MVIDAGIEVGIEVEIEVEIEMEIEVEICSSICFHCFDPPSFALTHHCDLYSRNAAAAIVDSVTDRTSIKYKRHDA